MIIIISKLIFYNKFIIYAKWQRKVREFLSNKSQLKAFTNDKVYE